MSRVQENYIKLIQTRPDLQQWKGPIYQISLATDTVPCLSSKYDTKKHLRKTNLHAQLNTPYNSQHNDKILGKTTLYKNSHACSAMVFPPKNGLFKRWDALWPHAS